MTVRELIDVLQRAPQSAVVTGAVQIEQPDAEGLAGITVDDQPASPPLRENALTTARRILGDDHRTFKVTRP